MSETDAGDELVEDYGLSKIERSVDATGEEQFHFIAPLEGIMKSFENPDKARLYASVYEVVDGFREGKTGERGAPPAVAQAGENALVTYYVSQPTMSIQWAAGQFRITEDEVRSATRMIRERAEALRKEGSDE